MRNAEAPHLQQMAALLIAAMLLGPRPPVGPRSPPPSWDLPVRAGLTAVLVLTLTGLAGGCMRGWPRAWRRGIISSRVVPG